MIRLHEGSGASIWRRKPSPFDFRPSEELTLWIGTGGNGAKGIYRTCLDPDTGKLTEPVLAAEIGNPGLLALNSERTRLAYGQRRTS